ncbi:MAG: DISARM system phospholipase D-like protein DrmC [Phycisphaerae bacterium]|jgi:hypothetical protein
MVLSHHFQKLTSASLRELASALREASTPPGPSAHALRQIVGGALLQESLDTVAELQEDGWTTAQIATLADLLADAKGQAESPEHLFDLVLSGPDVPGIPTRDTAAVVHSLIEECEREVILVGYAVHDGRHLFEGLARKMEANPDLNVWFCLHVGRRYGDTSLASEIVRRYAVEFVTKHWPWRQQPDVFFDPRALEEDASGRTSLHAKCIIVDRRRALITSANFTEAAHRRNVEAGLVVTYVPFVERIAAYFVGLKETLLQRCKLPSH